MGTILEVTAAIALGAFAYITGFNNHPTGFRGSVFIVGIFATIICCDSLVQFAREHEIPKRIVNAFIGCMIILGIISLFVVSPTIADFFGAGLEEIGISFKYEGSEPSMPTPEGD